MQKTVVKRLGSSGKLATWECLCVCGKKFTCIGSDLRQGKIKTCGCRIGIKNKRNWQGYGEIPKSYWTSVIRNADQRNINFALTIEELNLIWINQKQKCRLSGLEIKFDGTASLDRINNDIGYTKTNVQWLHKDINKMKSTFTQDRFLELCGLIERAKKCL